MANLLSNIIFSGHSTGKRSAAKQENVSINELVATALAEKLSALMTEDYLRVRAKRGSRRKFEAVLRKVR